MTPGRPGPGPGAGTRLLLGLTGAVLLLSPACGPAPRPSVVLVVLDTARGDRFSWNDYARPTSPALGALAAEGAIYEQAFTPAPWTLPAHASLFTGLFPSSHGTDSLHPRLDGPAPTLAEQFRDAGYDTAGWTENPWIGRQYAFDRGFARYEETWRDGGGGGGADRVNAGIESWLEERQEGPGARRPFFLFVNYLDPHLPYDPPEPERSRLLAPGRDPERVERLRQFKFPEELRVILGLRTLPADDVAVLSDLYDGEIARADRRAGDLADILRRRGLLDRTVLAVTSDHGEALGEHGMLDHKMSVYQELLKIPLMLRYPPAVAAGQRLRRPVMLQDLHPTLLALAGAGPGEARSRPSDAVFLPGVKGLDPAERATGSALVAEFARPVPFLDVLRQTFPAAATAPFDRALVAWREGDETILWSSDGRHRLYDLASDPDETRDLAAAHPARAAALAATVEAWLTRPGARSLTDRRR